MITRNIWFNFASSSNSGAAGIRPSTDKLSRFNYVVPLFKMGKMFFPASMMTSPPMIVFLEQIRLAMRGGFKGKDDFIDTISMLPLMNAYRPSEEANMQVDDTDIWYSQDNGSVSAIDSYIV
jgi:hypothetical protein